SPEAVRGAIVVTNVSPAVTSHSIRQFLEKVGPIVSLSFPHSRDPHRAVAVCKYQHEESATRAIAELDGMDLED
ncbi:hypothetical protein PFISCL1PPCAC_21356, partial [Pristionchus fissidentatus]